MRTSASAPSVRRRRPVASYTHAADVRQTIEAVAKQHKMSLSAALDEIVRRFREAA